MPALNFQKQFADKVERGEKRQTIRSLRKNPVKVGDKIYLYTGQRTSSCRKLGDVICREIVDITISGHGAVVVNDKPLDDKEKHEMAIADGFETWPDMLQWFRNQHGFSFEGQIIRW